MSRGRGQGRERAIERERVRRAASAARTAAADGQRLVDAGASYEAQWAAAAGRPFPVGPAAPADGGERAAVLSALVATRRSLERLERERQQLVRARAQLVRQARGAGVTWRDLAAASGVSRPSLLETL